MFSSKTGWSTHPNAISRLLQEKHHRQTKILDLTESNPTRCLFSFYNTLSLAALSDPRNLLYDADPRGLHEAREAVCRYYADKKIKLTPEQIFLTCSTSEAYGYLFRLLADAGDEILAFEPSYPLFETLADLNDVHLKKIPLVYHDSWQLNREGLEQSLTPQTKALLLIHPNNPTGHFVSAAEREFLRAACVKNSCALIVDEVFLDYAWSYDSQAESFAGQQEVLTFTLSGISKILGLPQMKLSWIVVSGPPALRQEALRRLEVIADAHLSVNTPSQRALPDWMKLRQAVISEINERVRGNYYFLEEKLRQDSALQLLKTEGGWYAVLRSVASVNDEAFVMELLEKQNVLVYPGFFFDFAQENFWVLSLLPKLPVFQEGVDRLCECFKCFKKNCS